MAKRLRSGLNASPWTAPPMMQMWADRKASVGPQSQRFRRGCPSRQSSIRIEGNAVDLSLVRERLADRLTGIGIP